MRSIEEIIRKSSLGELEVRQLESSLLETGYMSQERAREELHWFLVELGINDYYFQHTPTREIARHMICISASNLVSRYGGEDVGFSFINETPDYSLYILQEESSRTEEIQKRIETLCPAHRIQSYRTRQKSGSYYLRFYIVTISSFPETDAGVSPSFEQAADQAFLSGALPETRARYEQVWNAMYETGRPYIGFSRKEETGETRVMVGLSSRSGRNYLGEFSHLFYKYGIFTSRKYKEVFADGKRIYSFYFDGLQNIPEEDFYRDLNAILFLPEHPLTSLFYQEKFSSLETLYAVCAGEFTYLFISGTMPEFSELSGLSAPHDDLLGALETLRLSMVKNRFSRERIFNAVSENYRIVEEIFSIFRQAFLSDGAGSGGKSTEELYAQIEEEIESRVPHEIHREILRFFIVMNRSVVKTNFFQKDKRSVAFTFEPSFLDPDVYPEKPFSLFMLLGRDFLGFHVRFRDIARGGVRIVRSRSASEYRKNLDTAFLENYNLAFTQQKKNKDIPEGGSKGIIILNQDSGSEGEEAFRCYISGLLDVIDPSPESGEILFLGPDEGTAEYMDWASSYARNIAFPYWKSFTTGKTPSRGGLPHDLYGMTTTSVHEYVLALLEKLGLNEADVRKIQTGGPDGDLGSNEIKISRDITCAVIDGSGVLYDPHGIDRAALCSLAERRVMVSQFPREKLSEEGFFISVQDRDVVLPDGTVVKNGEQFRNSFHLSGYARADLFVPCGGRPSSINTGNYRDLLDEQGKPRFRWIVEGANLFITEQARLKLEQHGVILIKDAAANKGGVTSSSFEVFAALALNDEEYERLLSATDEGETPFRAQYVQDILQRIRQNARKEFHLLWSLKTDQGVPFTTGVNIISNRINALTDRIRISALPEDPRVLRYAVSRFAPPVLLSTLGIDEILHRVPEKYLRSVAATILATEFVYSAGIDAGEVDFFEYVRKIREE